MTGTVGRVAGGRLLRPAWRRRAVCAMGVALALFLALAGCTSTVRAPEDPGHDPVSVWLIRDASHRGLILPMGEGGLVEFGYGEYAWYAEMQDSWYRAVPAALWPTPGTLGKRLLRARDEFGLADELRGARLDVLVVARADAESLRQRLEQRFAAGGEPLWNGAYGFDFVPDPTGYWCLFNCNDAVAGWLQDLGCTVSWVPIRLGLEVAPSSR